jgi:hypothetical protein
MKSSLTSLVLLGCTGLACAATPLQPSFRLDNFHAPLVIDNPWSPMQPGTRTVFHELEDGECKVNDVTVSRSAKRDFGGAYAGLAARSVIDRVWSDPLCNGKRALLLEDTIDWYGQDNGGNVWYFGEQTVEYTYDDAGHRIDSDRAGSWIAGKDGAKAGIVMFAHPRVGMFYRQEFRANEAEDEALVERVDIRLATHLGRFHDCVRTRETTPLAPGDVETKFYCKNLGLVRVEAPVAKGGAELVALLGPSLP